MTYGFKHASRCFARDQLHLQGGVVAHFDIRGSGPKVYTIKGCVAADARAVIYVSERKLAGSVLLCPDTWH